MSKARTCECPELSWPADASMFSELPRDTRSVLGDFCERRRVRETCWVKG